MKVRGFQVAPAELEGHLLLHPDVADTCVVGVADDYAGEVPFAYVVLSADAAKRILQSEAEVTKIKAVISKVRLVSCLLLAICVTMPSAFLFFFSFGLYVCYDSMLRITRLLIIGWLAASSLLMSFRRVPVGRS